VADRAAATSNAVCLRIARGDDPHTLPLNRGAIVSPWRKLDFVVVKPTTMFNVGRDKRGLTHGRRN
jgi:hypothetical protein